MKRKPAALLLALALICSLAAADGTGSVRTGACSLPFDFSPGRPPLEEGFIGEWEYSDPTIHVVLTTGREEDCDWWIADVQIAHASQLRTAAADNFQSEMTIPAVTLADRMNAVVACNGDFWFYTHRGYIVRQGQLVLNNLHGGRDVLLIAEDGDFYVEHKARAGSVISTIEGKKIINALFFGPVLYENGAVGTEMRYKDMAWQEKAQRMAICQAGPLHYKLICCAAPFRGSAGMTLPQFADFVARQDVLLAYNLDGGNSCALVFHGQKINDRENQELRDLADIVYFASAYDPEAQEGNP